LIFPTPNENRLSAVRVVSALCPRRGTRRGPEGIWPRQFYSIDWGSMP
jgi:hypothetical protein